MVSAHENERFAEITRTTRAIMFIGTPHRGSDIAAALGPLAAIANLGLSISGGSLFAGSMRTDLVKFLSRESTALGEVNESFIPQIRDKIIISCFETEVPVGLTRLVRGSVQLHPVVHADFY